MIFSVLVPVYNVEEYLHECVESILQQTETSFEILLFDDRSNDNSGLICDEYAAQYPGKIRAYHSASNDGQLLTRRKLFEQAQGEWIVCVDSDDYIEKNTLESIKKAFDQYNADMIIYKLICTQIDGHQEVFSPSLTPEYVYDNTHRKTIYNALTKNKYLNSMCTKAFKRSLIDYEVDYTQWKDLKIGEDLFQSYPLWDKSNRIVYIDEILYHYRKNEKSITSQMPEDFYKRRKMLWDRDDYYANKWGVDKDIINCVQRQRVSEIMDYIRAISIQKRPKKIFPYIKNINEDGILDKYVSSVSQKFSIRDRIILLLVSKCRVKLLAFFCHIEYIGKKTYKGVTK